MGEKIGILALSQNDHRNMGSSGFTFEQLLPEHVNPDKPFGEQMSDDALQEYYSHQLQGIRDFSEWTTPLPHGIKDFAQSFGADLPFLESRGIDTREARTVLEKLNRMDE